MDNPQDPCNDGNKTLSDLNRFYLAGISVIGLQGTVPFSWTAVESDYLTLLNRKESLWMSILGQKRSELGMRYNLALLHR